MVFLIIIGDIDITYIIVSRLIQKSHAPHQIAFLVIYSIA